MSALPALSYHISKKNVDGLMSFYLCTYIRNPQVTQDSLPNNSTINIIIYTASSADTGAPL